VRPQCGNRWRSSRGPMWPGWAAPHSRWQRCPRGARRDLRAPHASRGFVHAMARRWQIRRVGNRQLPGTTRQGSSLRGAAHAASHRSTGATPSTILRGRTGLPPHHGPAPGCSRSARSAPSGLRAVAKGSLSHPEPWWHGRGEAPVSSGRPSRQAKSAGQVGRPSRQAKSAGQVGRPSRQARSAGQVGRPGRQAKSAGQVGNCAQ
jgi:hypothetical protein